MQDLLDPSPFFWRKKGLKARLGALKEEMLRDRLVVGIKDMSLSEKLQTDAELTLDKAKRAVRQKEAVKKKSRQLQDMNKKEAASLQEVRGYQRRSRRGGTSSKRGGRASGAQQPQRRFSNADSPIGKPLCKHCGKAWHQLAECPARSVECRKCKQKGHFQSQCFSDTSSIHTPRVKSRSEKTRLKAKNAIKRKTPRYSVNQRRYVVSCV